MKKRVVWGVALVVVLVLGLAGWAFAAGFTDIDSSPYKASINNMTSRAFVGGYADNTFRPDNPLQRQQFAKMAALTLGYQVTAANVSTFSDTPAAYDPANNPLYPGSYVAVAAANHILQGYTNGAFGFTDLVTRQQVISVAVRAAGAALTDAPADYKGVLDYSNANHGANVKKAEYNGLLAGISDLATWDLTANATRAEAAEILSQVFYRTGKILKVAGPTGTREFTMAELKALTATEGYGGTKNKAGVIKAPKLYKGVAIKDLLALVGGTSVSAIAADGYKATYSVDEVNGTIAMSDPTTGDEKTTISGVVTMIVAYAVEGAPLASSDGALKIAFVSTTADQVTAGSKWATQVVEIQAQ